MIRPIRETFFFTAQSFYEYVQSNQSNMRDRKKPSQQEQTFILQCFYSLFFRASVSSLLNKESVVLPTTPKGQVVKGTWDNANGQFL